MAADEGTSGTDYTDEDHAGSDHRPDDPDGRHRGARAAKAALNETPELERVRCVCTDLLAVTERSALATGRCLGRGDAPEALQAGTHALREAFDDVAFHGRVALGIDELLPPGMQLGKGGEAGDYDLAIGPIQEAIMASGEAGAISVIAASDPGALLDLPDMLVRWMAVGPVARDRIDLPLAGRANGARGGPGVRPQRLRRDRAGAEPAAPRGTWSRRSDLPEPGSSSTRTGTSRP